MDYVVMTAMKLGGEFVRAGQVLTAEWMRERKVSPAAISANLNVGNLAYENGGAATTAAPSVDSRLEARVDLLTEQVEELKGMVLTLMERLTESKPAPRRSTSRRSKAGE